MPEGLNELPPGLADFDLSKLNFRARSSLALHVRGRGLPDEEPVQFWIVNGTISLEPVDGAETVFSDGWIIPGLVDAHCHVGIGPGGPVDVGEAVRQAEAERRAGVLLIRDAGSPVDTRGFDDRGDLPRIIRAASTSPGPSATFPACRSTLTTRISSPKPLLPKPFVATAG